MTMALRTLAVLIIALAAVDPRLAVRRDEPGAVEVRLGRGGADDAAGLHARLVRETAGRAPGKEPAAVVIVDPAVPDVEALPRDVPVSMVFVEPRRDASIEIVRVEQPAAVLPGQTAVVRAHLRATGLAGTDLGVTLEQDGIVLAEAARPIGAADEAVAIDVSYAPPAAGIHRMRVVAAVREGQAARPRAVADAAVIAQARPLRVLLFEPRPSWALTFVRQTLEADPAFDLAALGRTSRDIVTRTAGAPGRLAPGALEPFDVVIAGAPEALTEAEVQALETFARVRGGAVVFQPDRLPSGPYARRLRATRFDEALLDRPAALSTAAGELRASEIVVPRGWPSDVTPLAARAAGEGHQPVIVSWHLGEGRVVFSGALDGWRYRADDGVAFERFWPSLVADLGAAAPRPLELSFAPAVASPGDPVRVTARLRGAATGGRDLPPISAGLVLEDGTRRFVRLWPAAGEGAFEGRLEAPGPGRHLVEATAGPWTAAAPVLVAEGTRQPRGLDRATLERIARATGGVAVAGDATAPLDVHLRERQVSVEAVARPMRSGWWLLACLGALCGEWALRRRRGLR
jgi:hypothetical protein